jgi:hypothetical protein
LDYVVTTLIIVVAIAIALGLLVVRHENAPGTRPSLQAARSVVRRTRRVAIGDGCSCGGTLAKSSAPPTQFGDLLGCSGCSRSWTMDGRKFIQR